MKKLILFIFLCTLNYKSFCCTTCNQDLQNAIYNSMLPNAITIFSAFIVLAVIVIFLSYLTGRRYRTKIAKYPASNFVSPVPLITASMVLGIGIGGAIDGVVLHQILQWHEMLSFKIPPATLLSKSVNMFWDGVFHAFTIIVTLVGIILLWRLLSRKDIDKSGNLLIGGFLIGWGLFNLVEGIIDHHILKLHNVKEITLHSSFWNYGFLVASLIMMFIGYLLIKKKPYQQVL